MKRSFLVIATCIIVIGAVSVFLLSGRGESSCEKVVEFTYSRTQPCNSEYYNYGFSVGPLMDLIQCWKCDRDVSRYDFRANLKMWIRKNAAGRAIVLPDEEIDGLCRKVEILPSQKGKFEHPIMCAMKISCDNPDVLKLLTSAYKECMSAFVERENIMLAEKATMREIAAFQRREREVQKLKTQLSKQTLSADEAERLKKSIVEAEVAASASKAEWVSAMKSYREKWDASLVFLDSTDNDR